MALELTAELANCLIGGETTTRIGAEWVRKRIEMRLGRYRVTLVQHPDVIRAPLSSLDGSTVHTTTLTVGNLPEAAVDRGKRIVDDLSWLLSLATMSPVRPIEYRWPGGSVGREVTAKAIRFRPTIETQNGAVVRQFVESTWSKYRTLKVRRRLNAVIHYLLQAEHPDTVLEAKLLLTFVALESLKATWATARGIPFVRGWFRRISSPPRSNPAKESRYGFEELVRSMLRQQGMRPGLQRVVSLRNEIVHFGMSRRPIELLWASYEYCQDLIREYLLRLLGFEGPYQSYRLEKSVRDLRGRS